MSEADQRLVRRSPVPRQQGRAWARLLVCCGLLVGAAVLTAQDTRKILPVGSTRDEVVQAYGWPTGQSKLGAKEILSYPQGRIVLDDGKVEQIDFSLKQAWPAPRPRPDFSAEKPVKEVDVPEAKDEPPSVAVSPPVAPPPRPVRVPAAKSDPVSAKSSALIAWIFSTRSVLAGALALGVVVVALLLWLVWRTWRPAPRPAAEGEMTMRISDAASGLPSQHELVTWSRAKLVRLMAAFVEAEDYAAEIAAAGGDKDIVLRRAGEAQAQAVILCAGSETGEVSLKRVREFFATMTLEGVDSGWYVAPAGFAAEAKAFASQHRIQLIDGHELVGQLREMPPLVLPKVLAKAAGK